MSKNENNGCALEINNLNKQYKTSEFELKKVTFSVPTGTVVGLIGENGSGKTTTLSSLLGLTNYESGTIKYMGTKIKADDVKIKENIGVVMGDDCFPGVLTPKDLDLVMRRVYSKWDSKKFADCLQAFNIQYKKRIRDFSSGMKRKVALAVAFSHNPNLLICDEVTSGLDPVSRETVLDLLMDFMQDQENSILITSHITTDLEKIADYIVLIENGKTLLFEEKDKLIYEYGIARLNHQRFYEIDARRLISWTDRGTHIDALIADKNEFKNEYPDVLINKPSIEDIAVICIKGARENDRVNN